MTGLKLRTALALATALTAAPVLAQDAPTTPDVPTLEAQFQDPPASARPRVWWHWMNGNVSKEGIAKDLAWMKRVGIGGLQNFDANLQTPQVVDHRVVYMTPEWKDAFRFAASEADRHGLELAIAASPGWSETGGPWVKPEDGLKKLVWSDTMLAPGQRFRGTLAAPPGVTGTFQNLPMPLSVEEMLTGHREEAIAEHYGDVAVLAVPVTVAQVAKPTARLADGAAFDADALFDGDLASSAQVPRGTAERPALIAYAYDAPQTIRSAKLFVPGAVAMFTGAQFAPTLEASDDGEAWRKLADIPLAAVPTTVDFAPVTARHFRLVLNPAPFTMANLGAAAPGVAMDFGAMAGGMAQQPLSIGEFSLSGEPGIDRFETKAGFAMSQDYYALTGPDDGANGAAPESVVDLTARMQPDGTIDWTPPKLPEGQAWRVIRMGYSLLGTTNHPAPPEATGLEVDKFDGAAVRQYMEHYIGLYRDAAGADLIGKRGVQAILTDSIEVGAANWTPKMVAQFKRLRGYDPTPWMPALTGVLIGSRADSDRFLYDYRRTLADLMASEHYGTVAKVAHENGLRVYGEALEDHRPSLGDDMSMRRHADVPMAAMWAFRREDGPRATYLADIKGAASVAHVYGQNLVAAESMTAFMNPWNYGPADLKKVIDLEFVTGVNRPVVHTSVHVPVEDRKPGLSLFIFGQYFNRNETWAEMARPWVDYMARNALMLQQGRNVADVAYFYGEEAPLTGLYGDQPVGDAPSAHAFDFVSADVVMTSLVNDGDELVSPGGARYRALYLGGSSHRMTLKTLRRLAQLVEGGATVVGLAPQGDPGLGGDAGEYAALVAKLWPGTDRAPVGKGQVLAMQDIDAALAAIGVAPDFRVTGAGEGAQIPFLHRRLSDGETWFVVNRLDRTEQVEAHFRITGKAPELWHAETGESEPVSYRIENGETVVPLTLRGDESVHVVFRQPTLSDGLTVIPPASAQPVALSGKWTVTFQQGRGAPASAVMKTLQPLDENADPGIKYFSGVASYANAFRTPRGWKPGQPLWLDLGEAREVAEVLVNGQSAGTVWHAPYKLDIGAAVKKGRNRIEVRVANLWVNRLIGDAQPGVEDKDKVTWTAMPTYRPDAPLRRSGLIGPVTLSLTRD